MKTRFLLCIGCHKGGTTWLAEYLRDAPDVRLGVRKEMHALDVHFLDSHRDWYARRIAMEKDQLRRLDPKKRRDARIAQTTNGKIERYEKPRSWLRTWTRMRNISATSPIGTVSTSSPI